MIVFTSLSDRIFYDKIVRSTPCIEIVISTLTTDYVRYVFGFRADASVKYKILLSSVKLRHL